MPRPSLRPDCSRDPDDGFSMRRTIGQNLRAFHALVKRKYRFQVSAESLVSKAGNLNAQSEKHLKEYAILIML